MLVSAGADVNMASDSNQKYYPLIGSLENGEDEIADYLLKQGNVKQVKFGGCLLFGI